MSRRVATLAAALLLAGCFSEHTAAPEGEVSFIQDVAPIFQGSCAFPNCHGTQSPNPAGKPMVLTSASAYDAVVGVASFQLPAMPRIAPGNPEGSYLLHKLRGTHGQVGGSGGRM